MSTFWRRQPMTADRLINRILRFVSYNFDCYQTHRTNGEYDLAVERLDRTRRLIALVRYERDVRGRHIESTDDNELVLLERHIEAMLGQDQAAYSKILDAILDGYVPQHAGYRTDVVGDER